MRADLTSASGKAEFVRAIAEAFAIDGTLPAPRARSASELIDMIAASIEPHPGVVQDSAVVMLASADRAGLRKLVLMKDFMVAHPEIRHQFEEWVAA